MAPPILNAVSDIDMDGSDGGTTSPPNTVKQMAYGGGGNNPVNSGSLHRVERGYNSMRAGRYITATPQFRGAPIYSPAQQSVTVSGTGQTSSAVTVIQSLATATQSAQITAKQNVALTVLYPVKAH